MGYDDSIKRINRIVTDKLPKDIEEGRTEVDGWKRWFMRVQRDFDNMRNQQQNDSQKVTTMLRQHMHVNHKNLQELHKNQLTLDKDGVIMKNAVSEMSNQVGLFESRLELSKNEQIRQKADFEMQISDLTSVIKKAEEDRMERYY